MKATLTYYVYLFFTLTFLLSACTKDDSLHIQPVDQIPIEIRSSAGEYCGVAPYFCDQVNQLQIIPEFTLAPLQQEEGDGTAIVYKGENFEIFPLWLSDASLAYVLQGLEGEFIIHDSDDLVLDHFSSEKLYDSPIGDLLKLELKSDVTKSSMESAMRALDVMDEEVKSGQSIFKFNDEHDGNDGYRIVKGCDFERYSSVENFIFQFTDDIGLGAVQLPGLIDDAFNECGDGYEDDCNNCVDPRCVIDQVLMDDTGAIGQYQKELMVAKYLELALDWTSAEFDFFVNNQENRNYMTDMYNYLTRLEGCEDVLTVRHVFDDSVCDIGTMNEIEYKTCIHEQTFANHVIEAEDVDRSINICDALTCFDLLTMNPNGTYEITLYIDQPKAGSSTAWVWGLGPDVGHTFIGLKAIENGIVTSVLFGFYPMQGVYTTPVVPTAPGEVRNDAIDATGEINPRPYDIAIRLDVTTSDFNEFITIINSQFCESVPTYNLNTYNCTDFALGFFNSWSFDLTIPDTEGSWIGGSGSNPGNLGEDLRTLNLPSNATLLIGPAVPEQPQNCI